MRTIPDDLFHITCMSLAEEMDESVSTEALCYKQRLEKSTGAEMFLIKWSPVADLLAAACSDHSVSAWLSNS